MAALAPASLPTPFTKNRIPATSTLVLLQMCQNFQEIRQVHAQLVVSGLLHCPPNAGRLLESYATLSHLDYALSIFNATPCPDVFAYNTIIRGLTLGKDPYHSLLMYNQFLLDGLYPDNYTYTFVLKACSQLKAISEGKQVHCQILKAGTPPDTYINSSLISMYMNSGNLSCAEHVLAEFSQENTLANNSIISGHLAELEPMSGDRYKLAGQMFSYAGEKENATRIRKFIKENDLGTTRGLSFIEVGCVITEFVSGKVDHRRGSEIHRMLETINRQLEIGRQ
ncbi:hypothetical protein FEM48_Zijuj01G0097600 [Ziziphus jujuba var. spinosa]|uniref:Pentatricopeptide repeat-containing protein n=1 Tax=Ziziphus jujuba var. spinosa TaxID=714518 RepID=A0A978W0I9_ZIZJJ|nr:hypothetical protein FEM48_Zijuj01G0097600 [Ziziphus jujuba var. spinosa]